MLDAISSAFQRMRNACFELLNTSSKSQLSLIYPCLNYRGVARTLIDWSFYRVVVSGV